MISKLLLSCRAATALMEKKHREKISFSENVQLSAHLALCTACRQYQKQSAFIEHLFKSKDQIPEVPEKEEKVAQLEEKILHRLGEKN